MSDARVEFWLSGEPLDTAVLAEGLRDPASGALVEFTGWVRNHHRGRGVLRLDYEAYGVLAEKEGGRVCAEAAERFAVDRVVVVHRVGSLVAGDVAVWVGVAAAHRAAAFEACRWVIDEVKSRVPVWKHEWYADGTDAWVDPTAGTGSGPGQPG